MSQSSNSNACPECGSENIAGLMEAFWVNMKNGTPVGQWGDWRSCTELGPSRQCNDCGHEWEGDE